MDRFLSALTVLGGALILTACLESDGNVRTSESATQAQSIPVPDGNHRWIISSDQCAMLFVEDRAFVDYHYFDNPTCEGSPDYRANDLVWNAERGILHIDQATFRNIKHNSGTTTGMFNLTEDLTAVFIKQK